MTTGITSSKPNAPIAVESTLAERVYRVPSRFGLGSILVMMTLLAMLFGLLRSLEAWPSLFLFFGTFSLIICLAQMTRGDVPRGVSITAGCVFLPLWFAAFELFVSQRPVSLRMLVEILGMTPLLVMGGGILGYLTGAVAAGVFLIMDELAKHRSAKDALWAMIHQVRDTYQRRVELRKERRHEMSSSQHSSPHVRPIGKPESVPVFNCLMLITAHKDGTFSARCANLEIEPATAATRIDVLQQSVNTFKAVIGKSLVQGEPIPWLDPPAARRDDEIELWIPVHF